jgi:hypothetical protein
VRRATPHRVRAEWAPRNATRSALLGGLRLLAQIPEATLATGAAPTPQPFDEDEKERTMTSILLASLLIEIGVYLAALAIFLTLAIAGLAVLVWLVAVPTFAATHPEPSQPTEIARTPGLPGPVA